MVHMWENMIPYNATVSVSSQEIRVSFTAIQTKKHRGECQSHQKGGNIRRTQGQSNV